MPMIETQPDAAARVYAKSLMELATEQGGQGKIEETLGELEEIVELARGDDKFAEFLSSRSLGTEVRRDSLQRIFKGRVSDLTLNFLLVLNDKGRIGALASIAAAFDSMVQSQFGRVEVDVFTAQPMGQDELNGVRDRLRQTLNKDVVVHPYVEPAMIGGVKFRIGDQLVDASIATRLRKLKEKFAGEGAAELRARFSRIIDNSGENGKVPH